MHSSHSAEVSPFDNAVFAIDWLETAGCVRWDDTRSRQEFIRLLDLQNLARINNAPEPVQFGPHAGYLHPRGIGSGRQTRLPYRFEFHGIMLALSPSEDSSRQFNNYYLKIPGSACLVFGARESWQMAHDVVRELGGELDDEWLRRLDLCVDLPGYALADVLQPAFDAGQFLTSAKNWNPWDGVGGKTGFTVGSRKSLSLNVYDKLAEVNKKHDEVIHRAMIDRRWGGVEPEAAARIEYSASRAYLQSIGADTVQDSLKNLGAIVEKLTATAPRPFFRMTDGVPDKANKHQSRAATLPEWEQIVEVFREQAGKPVGPLPAVRRGRMKLTRKYRMVRGFLASAAADLQRGVKSVKDAVELLLYLDSVNSGTDEEWAEVGERKAREAGTWPAPAEGGTF